MDLLRNIPLRTFLFYFSVSEGAVVLENEVLIVFCASFAFDRSFLLSHRYCGGADTTISFSIEEAASLLSSEFRISL